MEIAKSQNSRILKYILIVFLGSVLLTISSKIKIPFYPVPMTMQTFVVLFFSKSLSRSQKSQSRSKSPVRRRPVFRKSCFPFQKSCFRKGVFGTGKGIFGKKQLKAAWEAILNYFTSK